MKIDIDLNKRIDWIKARVGLDALTEQYVRLQMQEAVIETVAKVKNLTIPVVSQQRELLINYSKSVIRISAWDVSKKSIIQGIDDFLNNTNINN
tara:strand:+ start:43 stop:324 length:282 start_codon:yes stop_codon:yes gene_type:complete